MEQTVTDDFASGYVDFWRGSPPKLSTEEYLRGFREGSDAKRVLESQGFTTHNESYPELRDACG